MSVRGLYVVFMVVGTVVPWAFFGSFFSAEGLDLAAFVGAVFANAPASGFAADVLISAVAFLVWSYVDARAHGVARWWWTVPALCTVGLSLSLPLYLYLRSGVRT